jgi:hypothetical protein
VRGTLLHRVDRGLDGAEGRHDDDRALRIFLQRAQHQPEAVEAWHPEVRQQDVRRQLRELRQRLEPVGCRLDGVALLLEQLGQRGTRVRIVIDDQNSPAWCLHGDIQSEIHASDPGALPRRYRAIDASRAILANYLRALSSRINGRADRCRRRGPGR